jgi:GlpG protein
MIIVGELNDQNMAKTILSDLAEREIVGHYFFDSTRNSFVIAVENEEFVEIASDIYRVRLGLKKPVEIDAEWVKIKSIENGYFTILILSFCIIIYLLSFSSFGVVIYNLFKIDLQTDGLLSNFKSGQVWRIITPIFLHMNFMHILFNMLWFKDLGNVFEYSFKPTKFLIFIFVSGVLSNLLQYYFLGPSFGGMSGVIYGMLSFLWINKKLDARFEFSLPKHDVFMLIAWFFLCLFGIFPNVANFAHAGGAAVGILWAVFMNFKFNRERIIYLLYAVSLVMITVLVEKFSIHF